MDRQYQRHLTVYRDWRSELTRQGQEIIAGNFRAMEIWSAVAVIYLIITLALSFVLRRLERKLKII